MKTKLFSTKDGAVLYEDENGRLISSNMKAVKAAMNKIELILNKFYVVVDSRNNQIIHFCNNIEEAKEISGLDLYFVVYRITNNITCYFR